MQSFYLRISLYAIEKWPFSGIYPLIYSDCRSFYMQIHYMLAYFWSPYLSHITRSTCIVRLQLVIYTRVFCNALHFLNKSEINVGVLKILYTTKIHP